jgi:anti-sigma regulatory factor (Ser/Thr protein kinase)
MCHTSTVRLGCESASVSGARRFVRSSLEEWGVDETDVAFGVLDSVILATSELVSNAIRFSVAPIGLKLATHYESIGICVRDDSLMAPVVGVFGPADMSGRGLAIVSAVSDAWGYRTVGSSGKEVWCAFGVMAGSALANGCTYR